MADKTTKVMLTAYEQQALPTMFLAGMFQSPRINYHDTEVVEIDIVRGEEDISIAITDLSTGARLNSEDLYTNKEFKPPIHKEAAAINAFNLIGRMPGDNPYQNKSYVAKAIEKGMRVAVKLQAKIMRAVEQQASQVLQTGTVTLIDENGTAIYTIDYKPKTTHFPTAAVAWNNASSTKLADIKSLANVVRTDGLANPDMLIMGESAYELFIQVTTFGRMQDSTSTHKRAQRLSLSQTIK